jgi:hypothetical protein
MTTTYGDSYPNVGVAAIFASRDEAHVAVRRLHERGIHGTWIGLIEPRERGAAALRTASASGGTPVESESWLARVFGEGDEPLQAALTRHGVGRIDETALGSVVPRSAVLTVDGGETTYDTVAILEDCGGRIFAGRESANRPRNSPAVAASEREPQKAADLIFFEEIFYYDPAENVVDGDSAVQRMAAQRLQRPII